MALNDNRFRAASRWITSGSPRAKLTFIWDNLTDVQKNGLMARVKSDLEDEAEAQATLDASFIVLASGVDIP